VLRAGRSFFLKYKSVLFDVIESSEESITVLNLLFFIDPPNLLKLFVSLYSVKFWMQRFLTCSEVKFVDDGL
jgi:hypothetical protein